MKNISIAVAILILVASVAAAEPPANYAQWREGPAGHLMTDGEKEQWKSITSDAEAKAFIDLFWARRDPTPSTPQNEFREEFDKRVDLADQHFTTKRTRGAMTDRGRTLILLGSPFQVGSKAAAARAPRNPDISSVDQWDGAVGGPRGEPAKLTWTYANEKKPKFIKRKAVEIMFVDDQGDGQWQIAKTGKVDPEAVFMEAIRFYIFSPDLAKAPVFQAAGSSQPVGSFRTPALKDACDQFRAGGKTAEGPALLTWGQFVTPDGEIFVPVQLFVPAGSGIEAGRQLTFFGVVENGAGQVVNVHEDSVTLAASGRDAYVDKSLLLQPGTYKATFGIADAGKVLAMSRADMTIDKLDPNESAISDLILSNNAFPLPQAQLLTDPFAFGGLKVVPKGDARFSTSDDIWYFYELRNPGLSEAGTPKVQAKIDIEGRTDQDKPVKLNFPIQEFETIPLKGVRNHFGLGMSFPLKDFKPGKYKVKIRVVDTVLKRTYLSERHFEVKL